MAFANREGAGALLAEKLEQYFSSRPALYDKSKMLIVGLPRGGVSVALEVARQFDCPLEIIMAKKLPFPGQPEYAVGAVSSDGIVALNLDIPQDQQWKAYIEQQRERLLDTTMKIERQYYARAGRKKSSFEDKIVIVVDDGVATGMTAFAALATARERGARRTIMAAPVMAPQSFKELRFHCDDVIAVIVPTDFRAVGEHYIDFKQTADEEVVEALRQSRSFVPQAASNSSNALRVGSLD